MNIAETVTYDDKHGPGKPLSEYKNINRLLNLKFERKQDTNNS